MREPLENVLKNLSTLRLSNKLLSLIFLFSKSACFTSSYSVAITAESHTLPWNWKAKKNLRQMGIVFVLINWQTRTAISFFSQD